MIELTIPTGCHMNESYVVVKLTWVVFKDIFYKHQVMSLLIEIFDEAKEVFFFAINMTNGDFTFFSVQYFLQRCQVILW